MTGVAKTKNILVRSTCQFLIKTYQTNRYTMLEINLSRFFKVAKETGLSSFEANG